MIRFGCMSLSLFLACGIAFAEPAATPPGEAARSQPANAMPEKEAIEEAKRHFQKGVALYNDGNFEGALVEFETANALRPSVALLYNVGLCQKALFRYTDAIASLRKYLTEETKLPKERKTQVEQLVREMQELLADISVYVDPDGAQVSVDGRSIGKSPLPPIALPAGRHVVEVTAEGYKPDRREIIVSAQQPMPVSFKLAALPKTGKARIEAAQNGAKVQIDGKDYGYAPVEIELPGGSHRLQVTAQGFATHTSDLIITPGQSMRNVPVKLDAASGDRFYHKWWFWTIAGVAVAGATAGTVAALSSTETPVSGSLPGIFRVP